MGASALGVHHAPRDPFPVEMRRFPDRVDIVEEDLATLSGGEGVLVIRNRHSLICREGFPGHNLSQGRHYGEVENRYLV